MSKVSRSVYQKVCEENKRLLRNIYILCAEEHSHTIARANLVKQWRKKFKSDKEFSLMMQEFATQYLKGHPEFDITKN